MVLKPTITKFRDSIYMYKVIHAGKKKKKENRKKTSSQSYKR